MTVDGATGNPDPLDEALTRYRPQGYLETAHVERVRKLLTTSDPWARSNSLHVTASALVLHPPTRQVLLRWHTRQQAWLQVGGHGDPGETDPLAVALREGREETGLDDLEPWPGSALVHLVIVSVPAAGREPAHEHADLRYVLTTGSPGAIQPETPEAPLRWLTFQQAHEVTAEPNVHETLARARRLLDDGWSGPAEAHSTSSVK